MAMTKTFLKLKRQIIWTLLILLMSSNILCCISLSTTITSSSPSSYNIFYYGRSNNSSSRNDDDDDHHRRFNKNNFFYCRATTNTVRYASSSSSSSSNNNSNKNPQQLTHTSQKGDTAGHMVGSSIEKPIRKDKEHVVIKRYRNFTNQWLVETGHSWPSKCCSKGCSNKPNVGAHIFIRKKNNAYLVPMCQSCNKLEINNFVPNEAIGDRLRFPIHLKEGTPCVELTHINISKQTYINTDTSTWPEMLKRFIAYTKKHNSPLVPARYKANPQLGRWVDNQRQRYKKDGLTLRQIELLNANGFVWDVFEYQWDKNIKLLLKFKQREGHCIVPKSHKEVDRNLGVWLSDQRNFRNNGTLDAVKEKQLEELGVVWDALKYEWDENIILLLKYKKREEHCNVPKDHKEDGKNLGQWLVRQRVAKKAEKLDTVKEKQLEELGIVWHVLKYQWDENIILLLKYKKREEHCNVPKDHKEDGKNLGVWLVRQRVAKKAEKLGTVKEKQLQKLGVIWHVLKYEWDENIKLLVKYKQREEHCNIPIDHKEDGKNLGYWLARQRKNKKNKKLDNIKKKQLEELGVVWELFSEQWYEWFTLLVQHKYREGHCNVPYKHKEGGGNLGIWLTRQRHDEKNGKLDTVKKKLLEELGVVWDLLEYQWYEWFKLLVQYKQREGHCNVLRRHKEDGANLGDWLGTQRKNKKNETLDTVKEKQLEELGVAWEIQR